MSKIVGVLGASGRAGSLVVRALREFPEFRLGAALVASDFPSLGTICLGAKENGGREIKYSDDFSAAVSECDLFIDFSSPNASLKLLELCAEARKPVVIATTGFNDEQLSKIRSYAERSALLLSANMSIGIFALRQLASMAQKLLGPSFEIEILELHHDKKRDAPSGTALALGRDLCAENKLQETLRGAGLREQGSLGYSVLRGGDVVGEHTVYFLGQGERIELTHRATDRSIFARGALVAALKLVECPAGLYSLKNLRS